MKTLQGNAARNKAMVLEGEFCCRCSQAVLTGTNEQVNRYAAATRRARKLWLAPANPLPLP